MRAYRLYLAGSAMSFEQGWIVAAPDARARGRPATSADGPMRGAQSAYPFNRGYMYQLTAIRRDR